MEGGIMGGTPESIYDNAPGMYGVDIGTEQGHPLRCLEAAQTFKMFADVSFEGNSVEEGLHLLPPQGVTQEMIPQVFKNLTHTPVEQSATCPQKVGGRFPIILHAFLSDTTSDGLP